MRTNKILAVLAATTVIASGAMAQSKFWTGIGTTSDWNQAVWGDGNNNTVELGAGPGSTVYLFFKAQFQPGYGGSTAWAMINAFIDMTRQFGDYTASGLTIVPNSAAWTGEAMNRGYTQQTIRAGEIRANSVNPSNTNFPLVTPNGAAFKITVPMGTNDTEPLVFGYVQLNIGANAQVGVYELGLNRLAGFDLNNQGSLIGSEGVTVRTNFGTNGNPSSDYGQRFSVTLLVPEPASMVALGSGLVGLLALRRRRKV